MTPNPQSDGLGYNPRCIIRDISQYVSSRWTKDRDIHDLVMGYTNLESFQNRLQEDLPSGYFGIHAAGHYTSGGIRAVISLLSQDIRIFFCTVSGSLYEVPEASFANPFHNGHINISRDAVILPVPISPITSATRLVPMTHICQPAAPIKVSSPVIFNWPKARNQTSTIQ
jgi:hypothetical protein